MDVSNRKKGIKVLLIEKRFDLLDLVKRMLENKGYLVLAFDNCIDALNQIKKEKIDLILSDHIVPEMDCQQMLKEVRQVHPNVQVILMQDASDIVPVISDEKEESFHSLMKPFSPSTLFDAMDLVLDTGASF